MHSAHAGKDSTAIRVGYCDENALTLAQVDLAEKRLAFLKKINRKLAQIKEEYGNFDKFEDYIVIVAAILGIKEFIVKDESASNQYDNRFIKVSKGGIKSLIQRSIKKCAIRLYD